MGEHGPLRVATDGRVWDVTIDHPPTNLVDGAFVSGLTELLAAAADVDPVLVFRSADPDFFLMHGDVEQLVGIGPHEHRRATEPNVAAATFERLRRHVTLAFVDGAARGGGCEFLAALDFRFGTLRAVVGQPEVPMGILPGAGGTARWPRLVGRSHALEVLLTGRDVGAEELLGMRWLHALVEDDAPVYALARRIAAMPPASVAAVKSVVDVSELPAALVAESDELGALLAQGAHVMPMRRFLAAGGQTREGETSRMAELVDGMLDDHR